MKFIFEATLHDDTRPLAPRLAELLRAMAAAVEKRDRPEPVLFGAYHPNDCIRARVSHDA